MLVQLGIRDLVVVASLDLDFDEGLTVLTGETGAGKSILLTALGLALGDRADAGFVRPGAKRAEVHLSFDPSDSPAALSWLEEHELSQDSECLVRRVITQDGRSRSFINSRPATLQSLQELGQTLVEIHGQHAHVQLVRPAEQRRLLDEYAQAADLLNETAAGYKRWREMGEELRCRVGAAHDQAARVELLHYQIDEMEQQEIPGLDYTGLVEEYTLLSNVGRILASGGQQLESLYEDERNSVHARLAQAVNILSDFRSLAPDFEETVTMLSEAQVLVKEASLQLRRRLDRIEVDPARLDWLEQRLADVHRLARKHQLRPEHLAEHYDVLKTELSGITNDVETLDRLRAELESVLEGYKCVAARLSDRRKAAALVMQDRISTIIRELGMPQGRFQVEVQPQPEAEPTAFGQDRIEFLVSANPGLPPRSLAKVASGGELSRISLAIQVAATSSKTVPTLVFDEVDSGIGGGVAEIVGQKLRLLGMQGYQVFCVTHLPQVAVHGHYHLLVEKNSRNETTQTGVRKLCLDERAQEIARMLGGIRITQQTLAHAREMLALPRQEILSPP